MATITGTVNDIVNGGTTPMVYVNGIEATVADGTFMVMDLALVRGPNTIQAVATDMAGNVGTHSTTITYQTPPGVRLGVVSGNGQAALVTQPLTDPLVVEVTDDQG